jgi:hypothetical protein
MARIPKGLVESRRRWKEERRAALREHWRGHEEFARLYAAIFRSSSNWKDRGPNRNEKPLVDRWFRRGYNYAVYAVRLGLMERAMHLAVELGIWERSGLTDRAEAERLLWEVDRIMKLLDEESGEGGEDGTHGD